MSQPTKPSTYLFAHTIKPDPILVVGEPISDDTRHLMFPQTQHFLCTVDDLGYSVQHSLNNTQNKKVINKRAVKI